MSVWEEGKGAVTLLGRSLLHQAGRTGGHLHYQSKQEVILIEQSDRSLAVICRVWKEL